MKQREEQDLLEGLLVRAQPKLGRVLARYNIPPEDAEDLLRDVFLTLIFKREQVADPQAWAVRTLRHQCLAYWRRRRRVLYSRLDRELRASIDRAVADPEYGAGFRSRLEEIVDSLPSPCRSLLRRRYGLEASERPAPAAAVNDSEPKTAEHGATPGSSRDLAAEKTTERCVAALGQKLIEAGALDLSDRSS